MADTLIAIRIDDEGYVTSTSAYSELIVAQFDGKRRFRSSFGGSPSAWPLEFEDPISRGEVLEWQLKKFEKGFPKDVRLTRKERKKLKPTWTIVTVTQPAQRQDARN